MAAAFFCISLFAYDAVRADVEDCYGCYELGPQCALVQTSGYTGCSAWQDQWDQWNCETFGTICGSSPCPNPMDPCEG